MRNFPGSSGASLQMCVWLARRACDCGALVLWSSFLKHWCRFAVTAAGRGEAALQGTPPRSSWSQETDSTFSGVWYFHFFRFFVLIFGLLIEREHTKAWRWEGSRVEEGRVWSKCMVLRGMDKLQGEAKFITLLFWQNLSNEFFFLPILLACKI